jgi:protein-tyrosine-phosphatase
MLQKIIRKVWADPVWSKVIASGIISCLAFVFVAVTSWSGTLTYTMKIGLVIVAFLFLFVGSYIVYRIYSISNSRMLVFLSSGGTCRDPMAKVIAEKLLENRKLKHKLVIKAAGLGPLSDSEVSYAARYVIKDLYGEDLLANHKPELLTSEMVEKADLILAMSDSLLLTPSKILPPVKTFVLKEYFGLEGNIVDPWPDGKDIETLTRYRECANELRNVLGHNIEKLIKVLDL